LAGLAGSAGSVTLGERELLKEMVAKQYKIEAPHKLLTRLKEFCLVEMPSGSGIGKNACFQLTKVPLDSCTETTLGIGIWAAYLSGIVDPYYMR